MMKLKMKKRKRGFTMVEAMFVVAIISILAVVLLPKLGGNVNEVKEAGYSVDINTFANNFASVEVIKNNSLPSSKAVKAYLEEAGYTVTDIASGAILNNEYKEIVDTAVDASSNDTLNASALKVRDSEDSVEFIVMFNNADTPFTIVWGSPNGDLVKLTAKDNNTGVDKTFTTYADMVTDTVVTAVAD